MRSSRLLLVLAILMLPACESAQHATAPSPDATRIALTIASGCEVLGGGIDTNTELFASEREGRTRMHIEPVSTLCDQDPKGIWFSATATLDDGSASGREFLLGSDHSPVVLRQGIDSQGIVGTAWTIDIDFVAPALPFKTINGFVSHIVVEAHGPGGKIGEVVCNLLGQPDPGPRGPKGHNKN